MSRYGIQSVGQSVSHSEVFLNQFFSENCYLFTGSRLEAWYLASSAIQVELVVMTAG